MTKQTGAIADLFAGGGGISQGMEALGWDIGFSIERDPKIAEVYENNFGHCINESIDALSDDDIKSLPDIDLLAFCPPCQPFSLARDHQSLGEHKDKLVSLDALRYIEIKKPSLVLLEEVPSFRKEAVFDEIVDALTFAGYSVKFDVVDMTDWGVPQSRKRLIMIASNQKSLTFPTGRFDKVSWGEVISWDLIKAQKQIELNKFQLDHMPKNIRSPCLLQRVGARNDRELQWRHIDDQMWTLKALGHDQHWRQVDIFLSEDDVRIAGIDVLSKLQTFRNNYKFPDANWLAGKVIGNSVPPLFIQRFMEKVLCQL